MAIKREGLLSKLTTTKLPGTKETVADMFVRRTGEGLGALVGIASASADTRRAPERAGYIAASAVNVVSSAFGWETHVESLRLSSCHCWQPTFGVVATRHLASRRPRCSSALLVDGWAT